jgi:hypothetical protein
LVFWKDSRSESFKKINNTFETQPAPFLNAIFSQFLG